MSLDGRKSLQTSERGYLCLGGNVDTPAVAAVAPMMKWAFKGTIDKAAGAQVGAEMGTAAAKYHGLPGGGAKGDQALTQEVA